MSEDTLKYDQEKIRTDLLPIDPLLETAKVLSFGAKKYSERGWEVGMDYNRLYGALLRHMFAWWSGENTDPETGLSHLSHASCCVMFLQHYEIHKDKYPEELDNRPTFPVPPLR